jgi:hypothetical protein
MLPSCRHILCVVLAALAAVALAGAPVALAIFTGSTAGGPETVSSATLSAVSNMAAAQVNCRGNKGAEVSVTWTESSSSYVTSYLVERATSGNGAYMVLGSVAAGKTSYTDSSESLGYSTTYYYRVSAVYRSWSATSTAASVKTLNKSCQSGSGS